jgi:prolipoprotein diacylglyceryltransferase
MFIGLNRLLARRRFPGQVVASYLIWYGLWRFCIEFLRGDRDRGLYLEWLLPTGISTGQIFMVLSLGVGLYLYRRCAQAASGVVVTPTLPCSPPPASSSPPPEGEGQGEGADHA